MAIPNPILDRRANRPARRSGPTFPLIACALFLAGCQTRLVPPVTVENAARTGHEIIVAGQRFDAGVRVVTWDEPGGYNAYLVPLSVPDQPAAGKPYENHGVRRVPAGAGRTFVEPAEPMDLEALRGLVDQFVLHYDSEGLSRRTFDVLQKRGLSAHFLLDVDGTIYQTLDLRERAYHATIANSRSIGVEIANLGAHPPGGSGEFDAWYHRDDGGETIMRPPPEVGATGVRTPDFVARPDRPGPVRGTIHGRELDQYDFTPEQYAALAKLVAALHRVFPKITLDYPREAKGRVRTTALSSEEFANFHGLIGHFHIQENKVDPGPAFQWDRLLDLVRQELDAPKVTY